MYRVTVADNVRCAVQDLGVRSHRTILFVHGWPLDHSIFEPQYTVLPQYGIRCIGLDLRGFGRSDRPYNGYSYNRLADDLHRVIKRLDCRTLTLCGFSMGGAVCVRYMARHSGYKVNKLVLMGAAAPSFVQRPGYPYGMPTQQVDQLISQAYNNRPQLSETFAGMCFHQTPGDAYLQWMFNLSTAAAGWAVIQTAESLRDEDLRGDMRKIRVPTAIFHGVQDRVCPFSFAEEMRKGISNAFIVPFESSGHALFYEERDKCNSSLVDFV